MLHGRQSSQSTMPARTCLALLALVSVSQALVPALHSLPVLGGLLTASPRRTVEATAMSSRRGGAQPRTGPIGRGRGPQHGQTPKQKHPDTVSMEDFMEMASNLDTEDEQRARQVIQSSVPRGRASTPGQAEKSSDFVRTEATGNERELSARERRERDLLASGRR